MCGRCSSHTVWKVFIGDSVSMKIVQEKEIFALMRGYLTISVLAKYAGSTSLRRAYLNKV